MRKHIRVIAATCLLLALAFQTASAGFGKQAALSIGHFTVGHVVANPFYLLSLACLALQAVAWQVALRRYPLSVAYSVMSLVYVNLMILSVEVFNESITKANVAGSILIVAGVLLLSRTLWAQGHG